MNLSRGAQSINANIKVKIIWVNTWFDPGKGAAITAGTVHPFKCPVVAQDGSTVECKGGNNLADEQILGMNFYVKGIDDKIPGK